MYIKDMLYIKNLVASPPKAPTPSTPMRQSPTSTPRARKYNSSDDIRTKHVSFLNRFV